jgi:hypothetical protein
LPFKGSGAKPGGGAADIRFRPSVHPLQRIAKVFKDSPPSTERTPRRLS